MSQNVTFFASESVEVSLETMNDSLEVDWTFKYIPTYVTDANNNVVYVDPAFELKHGLYTTILLSVAYSAVFGLGLIGNGFVVAVVARSPRMRTPTNLFIVNLACADLLVNVLCLPFTFIANLIPAWVLGREICKMVSYLQGVSVSASVNTLMAISLERCKAISAPMSGPMTYRACRLIVSIIWLFALSINFPSIIVFTLYPIGGNVSDAQICTELWPSVEAEKLYFVSANLVICYLLPLCVISGCYIQIWRRVALRRIPGEMCGQIIINRSKFKVLKMLLVVIITFALSWLPFYILFCFIKFSSSADFSKEDSILTILIPVIQWLGASNSCINPIIYAFFNRKFRAGFKAIITSKSCCGPLRYDKYNSCYAYSYKADENNRLRSVNISAIRRERFTQRHFSTQSVDSVKTEMIRSRSMNLHNRDSYHARQRKESLALEECVEVPIKIVAQNYEIKANGATKV